MTAATYDITTATGRVRLLIPDRDTAAAVFDDDEIGAFLLLEADTVFRAAALALETIAADEALTQKVIKLQDLQTDGSKTATVLLARAQRLRDSATQAEEMDGTAFDVAEEVNNQFGWRERIWDQRERGIL